MLGKTAHKDLEIAKTAIANFWGDNCVIEKIDIINLIMFELKLKLYNFADVKIEYDRGTVGISLKTNSEYIVLSLLTDQKVYWGFEGSDYENIIHNFGILDEIVREKIS